MKDDHLPTSVSNCIWILIINFKRVKFMFSPVSGVKNRKISTFFFVVHIPLGIHYATLCLKIAAQSVRIWQSK